MKKTAVFIIIVLFFWSCDSSMFSGKLNEGVITYNLEYLDDGSEKPIIELLPTDMTITFKKHYSIQVVEGWMGIFRIAGIRHNKENTKTALLEIMADKYIYTVRGKGEAFGFNPMKGKKIKFEDETKEIAGYNCKKAVVTWENKTFDVYYTDEIKIEDPNWNNPYPEIDGVLMEYQIDMFGIRTQITAKSVEEKDIEEETFDIPADYKKVSKKEMEDVINKLM